MFSFPVYVFCNRYLPVLYTLTNVQKGKRQILGHQCVLLRPACVDLFSAGPHGSLASCVIGYKGTQDIFPLSEGFVVVPLKFTSARMFNWESAFAEVGEKAQVGRSMLWMKRSFGCLSCQCLSMCHLQTVTAYLMLICREVTVFGSLGIPVAGPIRPRGSAGAASVSSQRWWAPDDWRGRALQARCNLPNHSHQAPLS